MVIIIGIAITVILVIVIVQAIRKANSVKEYKNEGINNIILLNSLINHIQEHRGLTIAWLNGDDSVKNKIECLKVNISEKKQQLSITLVHKNERYEAFSDHWQRLFKLDKSTSISNSFDQHTMMIRNLAYLLEDTAEQFHLTTNYINELDNIGYVWRELILAIESIGQCRAIGTGVATLKFCSSVDKIRLEFLIQRMTYLCEHTIQNLSYLEAEKANHSKLVKIATDSTNQLISTMSKELVNTEKVTIDNSEYFSLASMAMSKMSAIFEHQIKQVKSII